MNFLTAIFAASSRSPHCILPDVSMTNTTSNFATPQTTSVLHVSSQPSPTIRFPSSHSSIPAWITPSPQACSRQVLLQALVSMYGGPSSQPGGFPGKMHPSSHSSSSVPGERISVSLSITPSLSSSISAVPGASSLPFRSTYPSPHQEQLAQEPA